MFELNGVQYSVEELQAAAQKYGMSFEEYMEKMRAKGLVESAGQAEEQTFEDPFIQSAKKVYGPVEEVAAAEPAITIEQPDTELPSEDISLDLPDPRYIEFEKNGKKTYSSYDDVQKQYGDVEAYVSKFKGKAKIVTPPEELEEAVVTGDAAKAKDTGDYLTEVIQADTNFFSRDSDQIKGDLEVMFPDIEFVTSVRTGSTAVAGSKTIKAKKDGKEIELFTDIVNPGADNTFLQNNLSKLSNFLTETYKPEEAARTKERMEVAEKEALNILSPLAEEAKQQEAYQNFDSEDLFKPYVKKVEATSFVGGIPTGAGYETEVRPHEARLKNAYATLKEKNPTANEEQLAELAELTVRDELKNEYLFNYQSEQIQDQIASVGNKGIRTNLQAFLNTGYLNANFKIQTAQEKMELEKEAANIFSEVIKGNEVSQQQTSKFIDILKDLDIDVDTSLTNKVTLTSGAVVSESFLDGLKKFQAKAYADEISYFQSQEDSNKASEDILNIQAALNATQRDYDLGDKAMTSIGVGVADIGFGITYLGGKALSLPAYLVGGYQPMNETLNDFAVKYNETTNEIRESYVRDVSFDEAFKNEGNFGKFALQEVSNQLPIIASIMASGGAAGYVIGASSAGKQMMDMQSEIANGTAEYSDGEVWLKSLGFGASEAVFAKLTTIPILNRAKNTFLKSNPKANSIIDNSTAAYAKSKYKGVISDTLLESIGEVATVGTQNLILGNPFTEGMDHAGFSGAGFGLLFSGIPFMRGMHLSRYSDYSKLQKVRDIQSKINGLSLEYNNAKSDVERTRIEDQIQRLSVEAANEIQLQEKNINEHITARAGQYVIDITNRQAQIQLEAKEILEDTKLSEPQKTARLESLQAETDFLQSSKEAALKDSNKVNKLTEFLLLKGADQSRYDQYLNDAESMLSTDKAPPTKEKIQSKALDLYFEDQIIAENNKASKNLGANFKSFNTVNEAIASIEADNRISDIDKKEAIANLKEGDDGRAIRYKDGRKVTYAVVENQVRNQRKFIRTHEVGHQVFWDIFGNNSKVFDEIGRQLLETTKVLNPSIHKELLKEKTEEGTINGVEVVARFLERVAAGDVNFRGNDTKKAMSGLFGTIVQKKFEDEYNFNFAGETDMFNFVVGIGRKIADGSLTTADIKKAKGGEIVRRIKDTAIVLPTQQEQKTLKRQAASARSAGTLDQALNKFSQNEDGSAKFTSKEEWRKSPEAGEAYFTVQQTSLLDGEIKKQAIKLGVNPEKLDFQEIKDNLALVVFERFDPSKNNLFGYLFAKLPNVNNLIGAEVANAKKKFVTTVDPGAKSIDVAAGDVGAVAELEADITPVEETIEREEREAAEEASTFNLTTSKAIEPATIEKAKGKVLSIVRTLKNKLGQAVSKNVNTVPVVKEVIQSSAKSIDIDLKKQMGGKGGLKLRKFVIDNKADIINNASATWLMGKDTGKTVLGGMPIAIEKSVGGRYTGKTIEINVGGKTVKVQEFEPNFVPYPEWVGQKIDREKTVERGQTSGNEIVKKVNPAKISDNAFADFVTTEDGTPIRGRKESLANELAGRLGGQIFKEAMTDPDSDISKAFEQNQDLRGAVLSDNFRNEVIEQTERGLIARSSGIKTLQLIGQARRSPELVKKYTSAYNQPTKTARKKELKKLNEESTEQEKALIQLLQNNIDGSAEYANNISETNWAVSENQAINSLIELSKVNKDLKIIDPYTGKQIKSVKKALKVFGGNDPSLPDTLVEYKGVVFPIEIKAHKRAGLGSTVLKKFFNIPKNISNIKNPKTKKDFITNVYAEIVQTDKYKKLIKFLDSIGVNRAIQPTRINAEQIAAIEKKYGSVYKAFEFYSTLPIEYVHEHYAQKKSKKDGTNQPANYLNYADIGLVSLKNNPFGWKIPRLEGPLKARVRVFKPAQNKDGSYTITPKIHAELSTQAADNIAAQSNESVYSIASLNNLLKNTNEGIIAASKGKVNVDKLNKKYEEQQESLIARSKGKLSPEFNRIVERASGIGARKKLSGVVARRMGKNKDIFRLFLPPSAEDFRGLYYSMLGSGRQGEADKEFFKQNLVAPYTRGIAAMEKAKQALMNDYKALRKMFREDMKVAGFKNLNAKVPGMELSIDQAVRIYLWTEANLEIPQLKESDQKKAVEFVFKHPILQAYANGLLAISKQDSWAKPDEYWDARTILSDLTEIALNINRKKYLEEFISNKNEIFSADNLNKIEAAFGKNTRQSFEDILYRMETGTNKPSGRDSIASKWNNWLNNAVGAIMFFNRRSATLQLLSTANFMNTSDNNPLKAAAAFANQPQYWKDWITIFNSPKLKERRGGLKSDVQEAEIAAAAKDAKNKPLAIISYLLKIGFTPTKIADSFAIASGGAAFYRNRINTYKKKGFDDAEAEAKAWEDFSNISDETQQSGDPMLISKQQAGTMGRLILAFQNTPMQITRMQKRDFQDLINRRRIKGKNQFQSDMTYLSRITYYTAIQNLIFSTLQNGLFTLLPGFDDEEEEGLTEKEIEALRRKDEQKVENVFNGMLDTTLRGSGLYGAVASTIKNVIIEYMRQQKKDPFQRENARVLLQAINISPPIGSKARKFYNSLQTMDYEKDVIDARGFGVTIDGKFQLSPSYQVLGNLASATINLPLDRVVSEIDAVAEALDSRNTDMQRIALALGWKSWDVGAEVEEHEVLKTIASETRKAEGIKKRKETAAAKKQKEIDAMMSMTITERQEYIRWKVKPENKGKRLLDYLEEK